MFCEVCLGNFKDLGIDKFALAYDHGWLFSVCHLGSLHDNLFDFKLLNEDLLDSITCTIASPLVNSMIGKMVPFSCYCACLLLVPPCSVC